MMLRQTLELLREYGVRLSRRAGQEHVIDPGVLQRMVAHARLSRRDVVLEIGAGIGNLTRLLAGRAGRVIAIERDPRLVEILRDQVGGSGNVEVIHADALEVELPHFNKVVSNLPYLISSEITFRLLENPFELAVLTYQKEFAQRLVAKPGSKEYSRLTVMSGYRASIELLEEIPPSAFFPRPKVASMMVKLAPRPRPFEVADERLFSNVVKALFQHRRKRVRNALYHSFGEVFPSTGMSKAEIRAFVDRKLPKGLAEARVMGLEPKRFGEIADLLSAP